VRDGSGDLICSLNYRGKGIIARWSFRTSASGRVLVQSPNLASPVTGLDISPGGETVGICTSDGEVLTLSARSLHVVSRNRKAHMVFGTDVAFASDGGALVSISADASARVTVVGRKHGTSTSAAYALLMMLLLVVGAVGAVVLQGLQGPFADAVDSLWEDIKDAARHLLDAVQLNGKQDP
jgi:hypothetical protein